MLVQIAAVGKRRPGAFNLCMILRRSPISKKIGLTVHGHRCKPHVSNFSPGKGFARSPRHIPKGGCLWQTLLPRTTQARPRRYTTFLGRAPSRHTEQAMLLTIASRQSYLRIEVTLFKGAESVFQANADFLQYRANGSTGLRRRRVGVKKQQLDKPIGVLSATTRAAPPAVPIRVQYPWPGL